MLLHKKNIFISMHAEYILYVFHDRQYILYQIQELVAYESHVCRSNRDQIIFPVCF